jgi:predicted DNA-binding protein (MmcQ/YjbR family)
MDSGRLESLLVRLRPLCLPLAESDEAVMFGNPTFRVRGRMFAVLSEHHGEPCLVVKVGKEAMGIFLEDPRFFRAPYLGQHGWVALWLSASPDWEEIRELAQGSHALVLASLRGKRAR